MKIPLAAAVILLSVLGVSASWAQTAPIVGGFGQVDTSDAGVKAAAAYAVSVAPKPVTLKEIVSARQQVVAGMNYSLCLRVTSAKFGLFKHGRLVAAKVFHGLDDHYEVTSWQDVKVCD